MSGLVKRALLHTMTLLCIKPSELLREVPPHIPSNPSPRIPTSSAWPLASTRNSPKRALA